MNKDYLYRRHNMLVNYKHGALPKGYKELYWIENKTKAYIDTFFIPNVTTTKLELEYEATQIGGTRGFIGARDNAYSSGPDSFVIFNIANNFRLDCTGSNAIQARITVGKRNQMIINNNFVIINGERFENTTVAKPNKYIQHSIYLFNFNNNGTPYASAMLQKIYKCKIWDGEKLVRDFVPCIAPWGEVGMYDRIGSQFHGSRNQDKFIAGDEIIIGEDYVQNGLVFWMDGRQQGDTPNVWKDRIQDIPFTLIDCIQNADNVEFNGKTSYGENNTDVNKLNFLQEQCTIEVVFYRNEKFGQFDWAGLYVPQTEGNIAATLFQSKILMTTNNLRKTFHIKYKEKNSISCNIKEGYQNKIKGEIRGGEYQIKDEATHIGASKAQARFFKGNIYAIRIYNRHLTEGEVLHNQQLDINNYFGGIE